MIFEGEERAMTKEKKMKKPDIKEMTLEEKWDRLHDFFTMDHAVSYKTHKRLGTVKEWVDDIVDAYELMGPRFIGNIPELIEELDTTDTNVIMTEVIKKVLFSDQMMHGPGEYEVSEPENNEITIRFKNCLRYKKQREIAQKAELGFDGREICEVEKLILSHPKQADRMAPTEVIWEETGCVWTFKTVI
jgi:hypothetical protein